MPAQELYINGYDAFTEWGISLTEGSLSQLLTPPSVKDYVSNANRMQHGTRVLTDNVRLNARDVTLEIHLTASNRSEFFTRYSAFCEVLAGGTLTIKTRWQPNVYYRMVYVSCTQFAQCMQGIAKFSLKLTEPNPTNRSMYDND